MKHYGVLLFLCFTTLFAHPKLEKVSVKLQWADQFQFAGYYVAKERGFYRDVGLDVTIQKFDPKKLSIDEVMSGRSTYGIGRSSLLIDRMRGKDVVVLAAIFQSSPFVLLSEKSLDIKTPRDLIGKRIMMTEDFQDTISIRAMLNSQNIRMDKLTFLEHSFNPMDLANKKTDVMACYISNEPFTLKEKGIETNAINPEAYGFDFYSDILFTSESEIKKHPKRVQAFVDATLKGWEYAFEHIPETAQLIYSRYNPQKKSLESLVYEGEVLKTLAFRGDQPLGTITSEKFRRISDIYRVMGIEQDDKRLEGFVYDDTVKKRLKMSIDERSFLHLNTIRLSAMDSWPPFYFNEGGESQGIAADFWHLIVERTGIRSNYAPSATWGEAFDAIKTKTTDVVIGASSSQEKGQYALFSKPFASFDHVIVTSKAIHFIPGIAALKGKRIAIAHGYDLEETVREKYPNVILVSVEDTREALRLLSRGKVDAVIDVLPVVAYLMNTDNHIDLKISGTTEFHYDLRFMIRNDYPELKTVIDKAIDSISVAEKQRILNRYIAITFEDRVDYKWIIGIGSIALLIISIFVYRQFEMGKYNAKLLKMATTDPLTGLVNRIRLDQKLLECYQSFRRNGRSFVVIIIDLDYFKRVNDTFGHLVGDKTLVTLSKLLSDNIRNTDMIGRWGGEEFMIICPETSIEGGELLAQKMKSVIENYIFPDILNMTCSFGISESIHGDRIEDIVGRADSALYRAKEEGRNRICVA